MLYSEEQIYDIQDASAAISGLFNALHNNRTCLHRPFKEILYNYDRGELTDEYDEQFRRLEHRLEIANEVVEGRLAEKYGLKDGKYEKPEELAGAILHAPLAKGTVEVVNLGYCIGIYVKKDDVLPYSKDKEISKTIARAAGMTSSDEHTLDRLLKVKYCSDMALEKEIEKVPFFWSSSPDDKLSIKDIDCHELKHVQDFFLANYYEMLGFIELSAKIAWVAEGTFDYYEDVVMEDRELVERAIMHPDLDVEVTTELQKRLDLCMGLDQGALMYILSEKELETVKFAVPLVHDRFPEFVNVLGDMTAGY